MVGSWLRDLSIRWKALVLLGLLLVTVVVLVGSAVVLLKKQEADGLVVNVAGRQRMLSQKMTKEALLLAAWKEDKYRKEMLATAALFDASLKGLIDGDAKLGLPPTKDPAIRTQLLKVRSIWEPFYKAIKALAAAPIGSQKFTEALDYLTRHNLELLKEMNKAVGMMATAAKAKVMHLRTVMLIGLGFSILVFAIAWWGLMKGVIRPLEVLVVNVMRLSEGELRSFELHVDSDDEIGKVARALEKLRNIWHDNVRSIQSDAFTVANVAQQLSQGNQELADRTQQQAAAIEQTASAMEELTASVKQNAENARQANELAQKTAQMAREGGQAVEKTIQAMAAVSASSKRISEIINVVNEIAFQTNLLALNAAVEAARAGEAGRGFAVVAGEVRNLAGRSAQAAKEVQELITDSVAKVEEGSRMVEESGQLLNEIINNVQAVSDTVAEITAATSEQAVGIEEVNKAITQMDQAVQQNAAMVQEAASASQELASVAQHLRETIRIFKVSQE